MNRRIFANRFGLAAAALFLSAGAQAGDAADDGQKLKSAIARLMMFSVAVSDMSKAKAFYADELGLKITSDYRQNDNNWWVSLALPDGGPSMVLTTSHENMKPGTMKLYFATSDVAAARQSLAIKGAKVAEIKDDLFGPGSGVKWFQLEDPDGNQVLLVQAAR